MTEVQVHNSKSYAMLTINFLGCGRLGKTLAKLIAKNQAGVIQGIYNSNFENSKEALKFIGAGKACEKISELPLADIYFITTPDDFIPSTYQDLLKYAKPLKNSIILHCSGTLTSDVFRNTNDADYYFTSIHPLKSFADPHSSVESFKGTYCTFEGDSEAFKKLNFIFEKIGAYLLTIKKEDRNLCHIASVMANNYLLGLHYIATELYKMANLTEQDAKKITSNLMQDTLNNLQHLSHQKSLTGPIQRGDINTVKQHLNELETHKTIQDIYIALAKGLLPLTKHSENLKTDINKILDSKNKM